MTDSATHVRSTLLFYPAIFVLNRLRYFSKFLMIGTLVLLPFGFVTLLQYRGASQSIEFNAREAEGVDYLISLGSVLEAQQRYWVLSTAVRDGAGELRDRMGAANIDVQRGISAVDGLDKEYGTTFKTTEKWLGVKQAWDKATAPNADPALLATAIGATTALYGDVGNGSNLILDPDLDSYWLMDAVITRLPTLGTNIATLTTGALSTSGQLKTDQLVELAGLYKSNLNTISDVKNINIATAGTETKNFGNNTNLVKLNAPVSDLQAAIGKLSSTINSAYFTTTPVTPLTEPPQRRTSPLLPPGSRSPARRSPRARSRASRE
jgi:methyl-accepting chemotaxis protein